MAVPKNKRYRQVVRTRRTIEILGKLNKILQKNNPVKKFNLFTNLITPSKVKGSFSTYGPAQAICKLCKPHYITSYNDYSFFKEHYRFDKMEVSPTLCVYCYNRRAKISMVPMMWQWNFEFIQKRLNSNDLWNVANFIYQYPLDGKKFAHGVDFKPLLSTETEESHDAQHRSSVIDEHKGVKTRIFSPPLRSCYLIYPWYGIGYEPKRMKKFNSIEVSNGVHKPFKIKNKKNYKKFIC